MPWTALIYACAPHPTPKLTGSCRDTLIEWELKTEHVFGHVYLYISPLLLLS